MHTYFASCRQWLPSTKLEPLGVDSATDKAKLVDSKKSTLRKAVRKAYEKAIQHRCQVTGETNPLTDEIDSSKMEQLPP